MDIGPLSNERPVKQPASNRTGEKIQKLEGARPQPEDVVEISQDARRKLAQLADAALRTERKQQPVGGLTEANSQDEKGGPVPNVTKAQNMEQIHQRLRTGFYDQPEVRREIADRLIDDIDKGDDPGNPL